MADGGRFFDDISTYLPDLLYNSGRFTTVQEVLRYIQRQARYHMNRFDRGRAAQRRSRPAPTPADDTEVDGNNALLRAMMGGLFNTTPLTVISAELSGEPFSMPGGMEPVIVRPTQAQINAASTLVDAVDVEGNCAVCQEALRSTTSQIRRLNHCSHEFHRNCIDIWFTSHVQCPVCRHDIRE